MSTNAGHVHERRLAMLNVTLPARASLRVSSFVSLDDAVHDPEPLQIEDNRELDDLRAARGISLGLLLGGGAWAMIGLCIWLIAH